MAEKSTYIKLDRNMVRWRWWKNRNTLQVFIWLLINANVTDHDFEGITVHRGQVATSVNSIANANSLTTQQVRTTLLHLKSTGEITIKSCNRYQVITIVNYHQYQDTSTNRSTKGLTNKQQTDNKQITNKQQQYKNGKNDKNGKNIPPKSPKGGLDPSGVPERGTDAFRMKSHLLLKPEEGTVDDIPTAYRDGTYGEFTDFAKYWRSRNR